MAQTAWVAMTRATAGRQSSKTARTRVDAGVKELNEMTIGRTDDPENPFVAQAFKAASVFGLGSRTPSGPAAVLPRQQAEHMIAIDPPVRILIFSLASEGPSTHATRCLEIVNFSQGQIEVFRISVDRVKRQPGEQQNEKRSGRNGRCHPHGDAATTGAP